VEVREGGVGDDGAVACVGRDVEHRARALDGVEHVKPPGGVGGSEQLGDAHAGAVAKLGEGHQRAQPGSDQAWSVALREASDDAGAKAMPEGGEALSAGCVGGGRL